MSIPDHNPLCFYCRHPINPVSDCWIGHGAMAHHQCAWAADEAFWARLEAEEGEQVSILKMVPVPTLPTPRAGAIDCSTFGCETNAVRFNILCDERLYLSCIACRALLICDPRYGWTIKESSRENIARRREESRDDHAPRVGTVWQELRRMRRVA